ncbi:peptidase inhibitor family I36 protein [Nocardiopsis tropica]
MRRMIPHAFALVASVATALSLTSAPAAAEDTTPAPATSSADIERLLDSVDAAVCVEGADTRLRCYATDADYRSAEGLAPAEAGTLAMYDCPSGYFCLWEWTEFNGSRVQYRTSGTKDLYSYWRDRGTSYYNRREAGGRLVDIRSGMPDPNLYFPAGGVHRDLGQQSYVYGGTWNNKVDRIVLS